MTPVYDTSDNATLASTLKPVATSRLAGTVTSQDFKAAFRNHPGGVAVITADAGGGPVALTATSVSSVSADPPLLVFSISGSSSSTPTIRQSQTVVVHLLSAEQLALAKLGSTSGIDRFADTSIWERLPTGEPLFPAAHAWIRGSIVEKLQAGNSFVVLVEALQANVPGSDDEATDASETEPLVYHNRTWHKLSDHSRIE
ncbi:flavin reductase family protein (plasmid) [Rhodococcus opacus]|uniref:flavin reductase family protein n=1 Tax=Rhodococcus opacus TaxID=37919 RepID=UPI0034D29F43